MAVAVLGLFSAFSAPPQASGQEWIEAPAEAADYQTGGTLYQPLMDFVFELESRSELMNVVKITETLGGRDVVMAVLSDPPIFQPADLAFSDKPVVLIVNNVHGGETAGKDAAMELMRDLVMGDLNPFSTRSSSWWSRPSTRTVQRSADGRTMKGST